MNRNTSTNGNRSLTPFAAGAAILILTFLAYLPAIGAGWIWDDDAYITHNPTLNDLVGLRRIWFEIGSTPQYYPLVHTTFWIERRLWGLNPTPFHLNNIALHGLSAVLLWRLLRRLRIGRHDHAPSHLAPGFEGINALAWAAAAIWAIHPVCVESVAWVTERKNTLMLVMALLATHCFIQFDPSAWAPSLNPMPPRRRWGWYAAALSCFVLALFSKTVASTLVPEQA